MNQSEIPFGDPLLSIVRQDRHHFRPNFAGWLAANMHVWRAFEREANRVWERGRRHYSARTIGEVLRHESALREAGGQWKLNNSIFPDLARLYRLWNPSRASLFDTRTQPGSGRVA